MQWTWETVYNALAKDLLPWPSSALTYRAERYAISTPTPSIRCLPP